MTALPKKISALSAASALTGAELVPVVQGGVTLRTTPDAIATRVEAALGLGNVDNTSDANKPVSTAQQTALDAKVSLTGSTTTTIGGASDANLLVLDRAADQVAIGSVPVGADRKLYVRLDSANMVAGEAMSAVETRTTATGEGTAAINPKGVYGTLWYYPTADASYTGAGSAVGGNAYTIERAGVEANVTKLIGTYGRARHENVLGVVTNAIALYADAAQKEASAGTITNTMAVWIDPSSQGTNNYGVYYSGEPAQGSIAAAANVNITVKTTGTGVPSLASAGGSLQVKATGETLISSTNTGGLQVGTWGELVETGGAHAGVLSNVYSDRGAGGYKYRNTNATYGGAGVLAQYAAAQTVSLVYAAPGTAGDVASIVEIMRGVSAPTSEQAAFLVRVNRGGTTTLSQVTIGASDSGGAGFRVLRVAN